MEHVVKIRCKAPVVFLLRIIQKEIFTVLSMGSKLITKNGQVIESKRMKFSERK